MDSIYKSIYCSVVVIAISHLLTETDAEFTTETELEEVSGNVTRSYNCTTITSSTVSSAKPATKRRRGRTRPPGQQATKYVTKRTPPAPDATHLPYTLVFYGERKRRRIYPQMAGYVVYRRKPLHREYLVFEMSEKPYFWTPPKGDVEPGETHHERAIKELRGDTGLTNEDILDIPMDNNHFRHGLDKKRRETIFFVGRLINKEKIIRLRPTYIRFKWLPIDDARDISDHIGARMLEKADLFLQMGGY